MIKINNETAFKGEKFKLKCQEKNHNKKKVHLESNLFIYTGILMFDFTLKMAQNCFLVVTISCVI